MFIEATNTAAIAGPAMVLSENITWLIPAIFISWDSGASKGVEACIAGI
ncbi:hypothetical protein SDC9_119849 [bioreactor metagenome]|uniref:Uncharacterized protein n=1 Tax=bioreactor metagenome TaxID=1076179 RepID=A0A645C8Y5_9ZZZZ